MADEEKIENEEEPKQPATKAGMLQWVILGVVVLVCAGSGYIIARIIAGPAAPGDQQQSQADPSATITIEDTSADASETWFYDFSPIVSNLDEPGATRYVRTVLTLEMSGRADRKATEKLLEAKTPILINWLTIYLASLSIDDVRGDKNLKRIQAQILDAFNGQLFPDQKPMIKHVLFKEFAVQ